MLGAAWKLLGSVPAWLGVSEAVQIEAIKAFASCVAAASGLVGAYFAYKGSRGEARMRKRRKQREDDAE